jgi:DNA-binding response OmpR family regulator
MRILLAEDDNSTRLVYQRILTKWGYDVLSVRTGTEAWEVLQRADAPKVAILDWEMPGIDGVEVCRKVRALESASPIYVIMLTGRGTQEDIVEGLSSGADDYVTKPFDNQELRARIRVAERMVRVQASLADKVEELSSALEHVRVLQGIIPICMHCHKIRHDDKAWQGLEDYIEHHSDARFSHGICPDCRSDLYPNIDFDAEV